MLKQGEEETSAAQICRKAGIGQAIDLAWKKEIFRVAIRREASAEAARGRECRRRKVITDRIVAREVALARP